MPLSLNKAKKWLDAHGLRVVIGGMAAYILSFCALSFAKYATYGYGGIDLAYYHQIFWRTLHGDFFSQTLSPYLSLAHDVELIIPALVPFYAIFPDPRALLVLQTVVLALPALPIYLIAKHRLGSLSSSLLRTMLPLFFPFAWLLNPFVHAVNLDEFHIVPFALAPLFFAFLAYEKERRLPFALLLLAALLMHESVAAVVIAFGALAWMERKKTWWMVFPSLLGGAWHVLALELIVRLNPDMRLSFLIPAIPADASVPLGMLTAIGSMGARIAAPENAAMLLAFGMPLLFLPYIQPKRLALSALPLLQTVLHGVTGMAILQTSAGALLLPGMFLAAIEGSRTFPKVAHAVIGTGSGERRGLVFLLLAAATCYAAVVLGPVPDALRTVAAPETHDLARSARSALLHVGPTQEVAASATLLPHLSGRYGLYTLPSHYTPARSIRMVTSEELPQTTDIVAIDARGLDAMAAGSWGTPLFDAGPITLYEVRARKNALP